MMMTTWRPRHREGDFIGLFANEYTGDSFRIGIFLDQVRIAVIYANGFGHDRQFLEFLVQEYTHSDQPNLRNVPSRAVRELNFSSIQHLDDAYEIYDLNIHDLPKKVGMHELKTLDFLQILEKNLANFEMFKKGDILKFNGLNILHKISLYHHHAIFADEKRFKIIHKTRDPNKSKSTSTKSVVRETSLFDFSYYREVTVDNHYDGRYDTNSPDDIVDIARERLDQKGFNIVTDNCQHFASECRYNKPKSHEIRKMAVLGGVVVGGYPVATAAILAHHFNKKKHNKAIKQQSYFNPHVTFSAHEIKEK